MNLNEVTGFAADEETQTEVRKTSDIRHDLYEVKAEITAIETQWKSAQTRFNTYRVKHDYDFAGTDRSEAAIERYAAGMSRNEAKMDDLTARLKELSARRDALNAEEAEAVAREQAIRRAQKEQAIAKVQEALETILPTIPEVATYDLDMGYKSSWGEFAIGWTYDTEGRDGKPYQRRQEVSINLAHHRYGRDEAYPATVNWSAQGSQEADWSERYGGAIVAAAKIARALDALGIEDPSEW